MIINAATPAITQYVLSFVSKFAADADVVVGVVTAGVTVPPDPVYLV